MEKTRNKKENELLNSAQKLQQEAKKIVAELQLFSLLKKISEPCFIGSVENGLMVWRDIDIQAYMKELDLEKVTSLLKDFALLPTIQKVQFSNFKELRRDHIKSKKSFPQAYYIGLRSFQLSGEWKIDIWFGKKGISLNDYDVSKLLNISKDQKIAILKIKKAWMNEQGGYKDDVTSVDIYKAVLEQGIMNENSFKSYLKK